MDIPVYKCIYCGQEFTKHTAELCKCFNYWVEYLYKRYTGIKTFIESDSDNLNILPVNMDIPEIPYNTNLNKAWELIPALIEYGGCPALIYNDFGKWAVSGDGMQSCPTDEDETVSTTFIIEDRFWFSIPEWAICYFFIDSVMGEYSNYDKEKLIKIKEAEKEYKEEREYLDRLFDNEIDYGTTQ